MYKYARALKPNRKTANRRIKDTDIIELRMYSKKLNQLVLMHLDTANKKRVPVDNKKE